LKSIVFPGYRNGKGYVSSVDKSITRLGRGYDYVVCEIFHYVKHLSNIKNLDIFPFPLKGLK